MMEFYQGLLPTDVYRKTIGIHTHYGRISTNRYIIFILYLLTDNLTSSLASTKMPQKNMDYLYYYVILSREDHSFLVFADPDVISDTSSRTGMVLYSHFRVLGQNALQIQNLNTWLHSYLLSLKATYHSFCIGLFFNYTNLLVKSKKSWHSFYIKKNLISFLLRVLYQLHQYLFYH